MRAFDMLRSGFLDECGRRIGNIDSPGYNGRTVRFVRRRWRPTRRVAARGTGHPLACLRRIPSLAESVLILYLYLDVGLTHSFSRRRP